jgi:hypothetical protein
MADSPGVDPRPGNRSQKGWLPFAVFAAMLLVVSSVGISFAGGFRGAIALLHGKRLLVDVSYVPATAHTPRTISFQFRNLTGSPVTVLGVDMECRCLSNATPFPLTLAAHEQRTEAVPVRRSPGPSGAHLRVITDQSEEFYDFMIALE